MVKSFLKAVKNEALNRCDTKQQDQNEAKDNKIKWRSITVRQKRGHGYLGKIPDGIGEPGKTSQFWNMNDSPVFIVDDDIDEQVIIQDLWKELDIKNPLLFFESGWALLDHMKEDPTNPFIIICDVNLPKMDGFELRKKIAEETSIHYKGIPFVFWSTVASNEQIKRAYDSGGHGFFLKGQNYKMIMQSLSIIITYWKTSKAPVIS